MIETYAYGTSKDLIFKKGNAKRDNLINQYKNVQLWLYYKRRRKKHNPNCPEVLNHPYRILIIGGSGSRKTNVLLNLINNEPDIDKIYLYAKDPSEAKYHLLIKKIRNTGLKYFNNLIDADDIYKNIEEYNPNKKQKILIVFDDMV